MNSTNTEAAACPKSLAMQRRAQHVIPGMTQLLSKRPDQFAPGVWPGYFSKAQGALVWDLDGNRYVDMSIGGIGANVLGYADPDVDAAVRRVVEGGVSCSLNCPEEVELAELLCRLHPWAGMVRFSRGGGEAMAMAVRIARTHTRRDRVAFCGYHGWHDWYLAANVGSEDALGGHLLPGLAPNGVPRSLAGTALPFHYNRPDELEAIVDRTDGDLAAIVMEPIRNEWPEPAFLETIRRTAERTGAVLVVDEISAGFRMNSAGAHLELGIAPDLAVFAKAMGNGYAVSAVVGRRGVMDGVQDTFISSTNWTERIGPAAAIATIEKHRALDVGAHLMETGKQVQSGWQAAAKRHGLSIQVGGIPPLSHFEFDLPDALAWKAEFVGRMLDEGFLASTAFYAMYAHTPEHVESYLAAVDRTFATIASALQGGENATRGRPAVAGFKRLI